MCSIKNRIALETCVSSLAEVSIHPFQRTTSVELLCTSASRRFTRLTRKWTPVGFPILSSDLGTGQPPARPTRKRTLVETAHPPFYQPTSSHTSETPRAPKQNNGVGIHPYHKALLVAHCLNLFRWYGSRRQITLVGNQEARQKVTRRQPGLVVKVSLPFQHFLECRPPCNVKDYDAGGGLLVIYPRHRTEPLLPRNIPQL